MSGLLRTPGGQGMLSAGGLVFSQLAAFAFMLVCARALGPAGVARLQVVIALFMLLHVPGKLGLDEALAYLLPKHTVDGRSPRALVAYSLVVSGLLSTALAVAIFVAAPAVERTLLPLPGVASDLRFAAVMLPTLAVLYVAAYALRGLQRSDLMAACLLYGVPAVTLVALPILAVGGLTLHEAYATRIVALAIPGALAALTALTFGGTAFVFDRPALGRLHAFSLATLGGSLMQQLLENSAVLLGPTLLSERSLGLFVVAAKLWGMAFLCIGPLLFVLGPAMSAAIAAGDPARARRLHAAAGRLLLVGTAALFGPMVALRREVLSIFGPEYAEAAPLLAVLGVGQIAVAATGLNSPALLAQGRERVELLLGFATVAGVWAGSGLLAPRWGAIGVGLALLVSTGVCNALRLAVVSAREFLSGATAAVAAAAAIGLAALAATAAVGAPTAVVALAFAAAYAAALVPARRRLAADVRELLTRA